jgi:hypothetical protein
MVKGTKDTEGEKHESGGPGKSGRPNDGPANAPNQRQPPPGEGRSEGGRAPGHPEG